jgi:hypothetical protein
VSSQEPSVSRAVHSTMFSFIDLVSYIFILALHRDSVMRERERERERERD